MLSPFQEKKLIHFFDIMDHDHNGQLEKSDFEALAENYSILLGFDPGDDGYAQIENACLKQWQDLVQFVAPEAETISKAQWIAFADQALAGGEKEKHKTYFVRLADDLFESFDADKDGYLSLMEYVDMFVAYGIEVRFSANSFKKLDRNSDDLISKKELIKALEEYFFSNDHEAYGNYLFGFMPKHG